MYRNPYCNRADTQWYTMDKATPPDRRKPPKKAQLPDAVGRAGTSASKLVMSRSAVRVRSSALLFTSKCHKNGRHRYSYLELCQQYVSSRFYPRAKFMLSAVCLPMLSIQCE